MATGPSPSPDMFTFILTTPFFSEKIIIPETLLPFFDSIVAIAFFVLGPEQAAKITKHINIRGLFVFFLLLWRVVVFLSFSKQRCTNPDHG